MKWKISLVMMAAFVSLGTLAAAQAHRVAVPNAPHSGHTQMMMNHQGSGMRGGGEALRGPHTGMKGRRTGMMGRGQAGIMNHAHQGTRQFYLNMREELGLTDDQVKELQKIRLQTVERTTDIQGDLRIARIERGDLLADDAVKVKDLEKKIRTIHDLEASLEIERMKMRIDTRNVLTPEQREQVKDGGRHRMASVGRGAMMGAGRRGGGMMHEGEMMHGEGHE